MKSARSLVCATRKPIRGRHAVKGKGKMSTWFLNSPTLGDHIDACSITR